MNQEQGPNPIYYEVQKFRQAWIWVIVLVIARLQWYAVVEQFLHKRPFGANPMQDIPSLIFWLIFGIGLPALLFFSQLATEVRNDGIYIRFSPFHRTFRRIAFTEVKQCKVRTYHPIREYGGWGIRVRCKEKAYNVSGDRGVQIELLNGDRLLIGSQRAEEFWRAIPAEVRAQEGRSA
jgi:hypothetical protein